MGEYKYAKPSSPQQFKMILRDLPVANRKEYYEKYLNFAPPSQGKPAIVMGKILLDIAHWDTITVCPGKPRSEEEFMKTLQVLSTRKEREAYYTKNSDFADPKLKVAGFLKAHLDLLDNHDEWKKKNLPPSSFWLYLIIAVVLLAIIAGVAVWYFWSYRVYNSTPDPIQGE